jgi:ABC-2 type transport system ATP-binding protein
MTAIETSGLRKVYHPNRKNQLVGLDSLDLQVKEGDIFGFIGPNGAGKSTTIKILVGLVWPTSGTARIFGQAAGSVAARQKLGYLPEVANYHEFMGVGELLAMHAQLAGVPSHERATACTNALEQVGLLDRKASRIKELSKGMKQRFGIAQALVASPPLLILDEVTSGLDPLAQKEVKDVILSLKRKGITIFFSSHQLTEVEHICDVIGIIHRGRLLHLSGMDALLQTDDQVVVQYRGDSEVADKLVACGVPPERTNGGGTLTLRRDQIDATIEHIHQSHGQVWSVQPHRLTLEDAFFNLIQSQGPATTP